MSNSFSLTLGNQSYTVTGSLNLVEQISSPNAPLPAPTPIVVPFYVYPGAAWTALANAKLPPGSIAVINPDSGPGSASDPNYVSGIKNLQAAGLKVLGYVATGYAGIDNKVTLAYAEAQCASYKTWYGVDGIFFDEMGTLASFYSALQSYVKQTLGMEITFGNPGTSSSLVGTFDVTNVYEGGGLPHNSNFSVYKSSQVSFIAYGVSSIDTTALSSILPSVSYFYLTNLSGSNPYDALPSYLSQLVSF